MSFIATIKQSCPVKCVICAKVLSEATDRYAISGKGVSLTWLPDELKLLNVFFDSNGYLCRVCRRKVEKHRRIRENLTKSAEDIRSTMYGPSLKRDNTAESDLDSPVMKKPCVEIDGTNLSISLSSSSLYNAPEFPSTKTNFPSPLPMTSTPKKAGRPPPLRLTEQKPEKPERVVKVRTFCDSHLLLPEIFCRSMNFKSVLNL